MAKKYIKAPPCVWTYMCMSEGNTSSPYQMLVAALNPFQLRPGLLNLHLLKYKEPKAM